MHPHSMDHFRYSDGLRPARPLHDKFRPGRAIKCIGKPKGLFANRPGIEIPERVAIDGGDLITKPQPGLLGQGSLI